MKTLGLINLFGSCAASFAMAVLVFQAGYGLIAAFLVYSVGGALLMLSVTAVMVFSPAALGTLLPAHRPILRARLAELRG